MNAFSHMLSAVEDLTPGTQILFLILIILASVGMILLLFRSVVKARRDWAERKEKEGILTPDEFFGIIEKYILSNKKAHFVMFRIDIFESANIIKNLGELQYNTALEQFISKIGAVLGTNIKIAQEENDRVYVYHRAKFNQNALTNVCRLLVAELQKSIIIAGALKVDFDINVGVVTYPGGGKDMDGIKQNLQLAVVAAQRKGVNQYAFYDITLTNQESEEYKSYIEIKEAIDNKDFTLYYQPIVNFSTMEVFAAESLLRWKHKERGVLPPSTFLNIMEHTGDINWVGFWAIEQLFKQQLQWRTQYPDVKFTLSTNLSPKQLMNPQLAEELRRLVKKHKVVPSDFTFEVVQSALSDALDVIKSNLKALHEIGFLIAIDNYGASDSSVQNLANFPVNMIKLSRGIINEAKNNEFTYDIIQMLVKHGENHNIKMVAEGVENTEYLEYVQSLGLGYGQGYHFAKPGAPSDLMNAVIMTPWTSANNG